MSGGFPVAVGGLLLAGSVMLLAASIGLLRFPDLHTRMHAVLKAGTVGAVAIFSSLAVASPEVDILARVAGAVALLLLGGPVAAQGLSGSRPVSDRSISAYRRNRAENAKR